MHTTMTSTGIADLIRQLAAEQAGLDPRDITLTCHLQNDLNLDSLDQVEFAMAIEDALGITIPDESAQEVRTVGQAVEMVEGILREWPRGERESRGLHCTGMS